MKNKRIIAPKRKDQKGQSLVELALTVTALLLLISGAVDFGMAFFEFVALNDAAQEGALYGSINPEADGLIVQRIRSSSTTPIDFTDPGAVEVVINKSAPACTGGWIRIILVYNHVMFMPFFSGIEIPLQAQATDTILKPKCP